MRRLAQRAAVLLVRDLVERGAAGPWMLAHDDRPDAWDPYTFKWWDGTALVDPVNQYVDVLRDAAAW